MKKLIKAKITKAVLNGIGELKESNLKVSQIQRIQIIKTETTESAKVISQWLNDRQILVVLEIKPLKPIKKKVSPNIEKNRKAKVLYKKHRGLPKDLVDEYYL